MSLAFATPKAQNYSHDNWDSNLTHFARKEAMKYFSLRGRRSKGKGEGIRARDHARGRREEGNTCKEAIAFAIPPTN